MGWFIQTTEGRGKNEENVKLFKKTETFIHNFGIRFRFFSQLTTSHLPPNSVKSIGDGRNYSGNILKSAGIGNLIRNITNSGQEKKRKTGIEKTTPCIKCDLKIIDSGNKLYRYQEMRLMEATAYYPGPECTGKYSVHGKTYNGKKARYGLVAVDPKVIPLGTKLYIEGYGTAEAVDIGSHRRHFC